MSVVVIDYRQPCVLTRQELRGPSNAGDGPCPLDVVRALCRALRSTPGLLAFQPDPEARALRDEQARAFALDGRGRRVARVRGLSASWLTVSAACLNTRGWSPQTTVTTMAEVA